MNHFSRPSLKNPVSKYMTKVLLFLFVLTIVVFIVSFRIGHRWGLLIAFTILVFLYIVAFLLPPRFLEDRFTWTALGGNDAWGINKYLQEIFTPLQEHAPSVHVFDSEAVNAFTTSRPFQTPKIFISRAFLEKLNDTEIKAALTILCARLVHQEGFKEALMGLIRQIVAGLGENLDQVFRTRIFSRTLTPISRLFGKVLYSFKHTYRQDRWAADALEDKTLVANVLRKLYAYSLSLPLKTPLGFEQDFIVTPDPLVKNFLPLQVSVKRRLIQLEGVYPN